MHFPVRVFVSFLHKTPANLCCATRGSKMLKENPTRSMRHLNRADERRRSEASKGHRSHFGSRYQLVTCYARSFFAVGSRQRPRAGDAHRRRRSKKSWQHPKEFPSGPPPQYYPGPAVVNFGVLKRSSVFTAVWPPAINGSRLGSESKNMGKSRSC